MSSSTEIVDAETENEEKNVPKQPSQRKRLLKEAMRDIIFSVALVILTTLVTQGDFDLQNSPTTSILASGNNICEISR